MTELSKKYITTLKNASRKLTGPKRRAFQAQVCKDYFNSKAYLAEKVLGWDRDTVTLGLHELRTGIVCIDNFKARGNKKTEIKNPQLEADLIALAEPESQADPKFQTKFKYTRLTAKAIRQALITEKGWNPEVLPCEKTISNILNRLGFRLRRVQKAKPFKKVAETDAIFANVRKRNRQSDLRDDSLRISIDVKAKVDLCHSSRRGRSRGRQAVNADDHDLGTKEKLIPFGILEVMTGLLTIIFGASRETSDFIVDCLQKWWDANKSRHSNIKQLVINLDNGPQNSSRRQQFIKRIVAFADQNNLEVILVYYPPYHSKYNPIERCWGILENHWNGTILDTIQTTLEWSKTMTWKGLNPVVDLVKNTYEKGVKVAKQVFKSLAERLTRDISLPKYDVVIKPQV